MTWTSAMMNKFRLLSPSRATEDPKCFVGIDIPDSFKIIWLIQKKKEDVITVIMHVFHDSCHVHDKMNHVKKLCVFIGRLIFLAELEAHIACTR